MVKRIMQKMVGKNGIEIGVDKFGIGIEMKLITMMWN